MDAHEFDRIIDELIDLGDDAWVAAIAALVRKRLDDLQRDDPDPHLSEDEP